MRTRNLYLDPGEEISMRDDVFWAVEHNCHLNNGLWHDNLDEQRGECFLDQYL